MDKKLKNLYNKNDDPMMWELREIKIKMSNRKITAEQISENAKNIWDEFHKQQKRRTENVSDKSSKYEKKKL